VRRREKRHSGSSMEGSVGRIKLACHFLPPLTGLTLVPATVSEARKRMAHIRVAKAANLMHFALAIHNSPALSAHLESALSNQIRS